MPTRPVDIPWAQLTELCQRYHIRKLAMFGSSVRDDWGPDSDLDMLVVFEPDRAPSMFKLVGIQQELSELFGLPVDLRTVNGISRHFRSDVRREAKVTYERTE